jgi:hypothetical protein
MRKLHVITLLTTCFTTLVHAYTLKEVIDASPQLAQTTPSLLMAPCAGTPIQLNGKTYELRLVTFEQNGVSHAKAPTFKDFVTKWDQLSATPLQRSEALIPTDYFTATPEMKEKGFFYLVSLREVTDPQLVTQLKAR